MGLPDSHLKEAGAAIAELASLISESKSWLEWSKSSGLEGLELELQPLPRLPQGRHQEQPSQGQRRSDQQQAQQPSQRAASQREAAPSRSTAQHGPADRNPADRSPADRASATPNDVDKNTEQQAKNREALRRLAPPAQAKAPPAPALLTLKKGKLENASEHLAALHSKLSTCQDCELCESRQNIVFSRGSGKIPLLFIGDTPDEVDEESGKPFQSEAGQLLDKMIQAMNLELDDVYICNAVKCRPPKDRKVRLGEIEACAPNLAEQIRLINPEFIVALGATAAEALWGSIPGISKLPGKWKLYNGIAVMPTYHPAYLLRQPSAKRLVWSDLQAVMAKIQP